MENTLALTHFRTDGKSLPGTRRCSSCRERRGARLIRRHKLLVPGELQDTSVRDIGTREGIGVIGRDAC
jgi:hypothetical protein